MTILYEDDCILVCVKPAGIATQAAKVTQKDMVSEVNEHIKRAGGKNPAYLIHRLDKQVAGILLFAKTKEAAGVLSDALRNGKIKKHYYALVEGKIKERSGELTDYILKDDKTKKGMIVSENIKGAKPVKLKYSVADPEKLPSQLFKPYDEKDTTVLDIELITGRFHQIRTQLSNIGHPILNDTQYGAKETGNKNEISLVAYKLTFMHPKTKEEMTFNIA